MDIKTWFDKKGSYSEGLELYHQLPNCSQVLVKSLVRETSANMLRLKYELKLALNASSAIIVLPKVNKPIQVEKRVKSAAIDPLLVEHSAGAEFGRETMAQYPAELHPVYRNRVHDFHQACELKFKLNRLKPGDEDGALEIILELERLWANIDRYWNILNHWNDHKRIMPIAESEDFTALNGIQLVKRRDQLQVSISKREKTIRTMAAYVDAHPEERGKLNLLNKKKEELQQLIIDLETIRDILNKENEAG